MSEEFLEITTGIGLAIDENGLPRISLLSPLTEEKPEDEIEDVWEWLMRGKSKKEKRDILWLKKEIEYTNFYIKLNDQGAPYLDYFAFIPTSCPKAPESEPEKKPVEVKSPDGTTVFQIQNLNIYITAEVVNQLNMNPREVVNYFSDKIKSELDDIVKGVFNPEEE